MSKLQRLPDSELEIMMTVWNANGSVTADYIMENTGKSYAKTTVLTFLSRLCAKGFLSCTKEGRHNLYSPLADKNEYLGRESQSFFSRVWNNSLTGLVASLYDGKSISEKDLEELKKFIEEMK